MKKIIYQTVVYLLPILLLLLSIELLYQIVPNNYTLKNKNVQKSYADTKVLIFGNSHTFYGLNPKYFDKPTFNFSNISQSIYFDQLLFDKHIDKFKSLQYIILNVEYTSLSQVDNTEEDIWRKYYYKEYMDLEVPIIANFDPKVYFLSSTRSFSTNLKLIKRFISEGTLVDCDEKGFGINYVKENRQLNIDKIALFTVKKHEDNSLDFSKNISKIQSIINKCNQKKIKVIIVTMPTSKEYSSGVNQLKLKKIINTCSSFKNVCYLNLFKDSRFTNDDFYDADHLHNDGAKKCSVIINDFISKI